MEPACPLGQAVRACPFLSSVRQRQGEAYARSLAANPFARAGGPVLLEDGLSSFEAAVRLFHGPKGVVPLKRYSEPAEPAEQPAAPPASGCPYHAASAAAAAPSPATAPNGASCAAAAAAAPPASRQPARPAFASISLSGFGFVVRPALHAAWGCCRCSFVHVLPPLRAARPALWF